MIEIVTHDGIFEVDTVHPPRKWLADVVPKTEVEGTVFIAFAARLDDGSTYDVLLRLGSIEHVQDAR